ncbi:hypothetical protein ACJJIK_10645 [Microbulbifer sp. ZKSA006]|uniref:hypothetical protein n=1 Tax=Microbulbifer sp. ZKSA006 TaxID=3243390 RepID=UPI00403967E5
MGNLIFGTTTIEGRTFDDIKIQTSKAGVPRPIVFGKVFPIVGNVIATTAPKIVKKKEKQDSGKGGGSTEVVNEEVYRTYAIRICEGPITGISRVWRNNELVYERDSSDSTQIENNRAFVQLAEFFLGDWEQMPSSVMQAAFGVSEVHAYRGTCYMVIDNENLTSTGGAIPQFAFEVERAEGRVLTSRLYPLEVNETLAVSAAVTDTAAWQTPLETLSASAAIGAIRSAVVVSYSQHHQPVEDFVAVGASIGAIKSEVTVGYVRYDQPAGDFVAVGASIGAIKSEVTVGYVSYDQPAEDFVAVGASINSIKSTVVGS